VRKAARVLGVAYLVILAVSTTVRHVRHEPPSLAPGAAVAEVQEVDGDRILPRTVRLAYFKSCPADDPQAPAVVLIHGSPGGKHDFKSVVPGLASHYCVVVPDLPGFGDSDHEIADYSFHAHARYVLELLDALRIDDAHIVGFSMGGGVALSIADLAPKRVRSITMLSAIGVQEMELLGDYTLNHALHGAQLAGLWGMRELTPHFGWLDDAVFGVPYARNFYDSDQRPLRGILARWAGPMLIVHGRHDPLVPIQAAREHARIVPQSELVVTDKSHFMVFMDGPMIASTISTFLARVDRGDAVTRDRAQPVRVAASLVPFDPRALPKISGLPWVLVLVLIALSTLISEDLTCIGAGLLVATGRIGFVPASFACFAGIFVGDLNAFLAGRVFGRAALARAPLKWMVTREQVRRASVWFCERGPTVILASRFLPGTRVATFIAAGVLHTPFWTFTLWFGLAALLWTPLLVGISAAVGAPILGAFRRFELWALPAVVVTAVVVLLALRVVPKLFSWRGRRLLLGSWRRIVRWEYWPPYVFYMPVAVYVLWLGIRHRGLTLFTAANPAIEAGGFINESKASILRGLSAAGDAVPRWRLIPAAADAATRREEIRRFVAGHGLTLPIVVKPDAGQRGSGVVIARSWEAVDEYLDRAAYDVIVQEYVSGVEHGVFYARKPSEETGRIIAVTEKSMPVVAGDGRRTLEELILADPRAIAMAGTYLAEQEPRLREIPAAGEAVQLVELGTHCRGAYFGDGARLVTPELTAAIDRVSRTFEGFFFGRYDVRSDSTEEFRRGVFRVIELNGVTSEATSIYDPAHGLLDAYRTLFAQWRLAFEIGEENRERGAAPASPLTLVRLAARYRATSGGHPERITPETASPGAPPALP
jgi:pimeloyl-ACP methyl ester carboxylesterase/membrane protein DedA with SNARE-associated domain